MSNFCTFNLNLKLIFILFSCFRMQVFAYDLIENKDKASILLKYINLCKTNKPNYMKYTLI
jgi:hypothetical protein